MAWAGQVRKIVIWHRKGRLGLTGKGKSGWGRICTVKLGIDQYEVRIVLSRKVEEGVVAIRYALAGDDLIGSGEERRAVGGGSGLTCLGESGVVLFR